MAIPATVRREFAAFPGLDTEGVLSALALPIVVIDRAHVVLYVNAAAEQLFRSSASHIVGQTLTDYLPGDSPLFALIEQVRAQGNAVSEYGMNLETPRIGSHFVNVQASPLGEGSERVVLVFQPRSIADKIDRQLTHRGAARSVTAMAAMLAHEVKNPLSGIRGAAQLLEQSVPPQDRALAQLIRDEADRICDLVDRMEVFSDAGPIKRDAVNIHQVLDRVRQLAQSGFARHVRFACLFDPSLPPVYGHRDQLIQVFLNLVKNAAEAVPSQGGEITLSTAYQHGVRFAVAASNARVHLPLVVSVQDNGEGIPEDIRSYLFDPFVTTKPKGSGLGLALVAKIIGDHGGVIEFDSRPRRTVFRVLLPMVRENEEPA
jgi:two-component system nitrogen regulation sensor histidine kinase GlnL